MMKLQKRTIEKTLSANDIGDTGAHQAGICVPKNHKILGFFPKLNASDKNPRAILDMEDDTGRFWTFCFIYYNNKFFGGTRNEYRLTGMTAFFREFDLKKGDTVIFIKKSDKNISITYRRLGKGDNDNVIKLASTWKVIEVDTE